MEKSIIANYASAFFALAEEEHKEDIYLKDALLIQKIFLENEDLLKLLSNYFIDLKERLSLVDKIFNVLSEEHSRDFLKIIILNHKLNYIDAIIDVFCDLYNAKNNVEKGIVYSTILLTEEEVKKIENIFLVKKSKKVELINKIDKSLLGGIKVVIKDRVYDGSIKNQLAGLKKSLKKEGNI